MLPTEEPYGQVMGEGGVMGEGRSYGGARRVMGNWEGVMGEVVRERLGQDGYRYFYGRLGGRNETGTLIYVLLNTCNNTASLYDLV